LFVIDRVLILLATLLSQWEKQQKPTEDESNYVVTFNSHYYTENCFNNQLIELEQESAGPYSVPELKMSCNDNKKLLFIITL